MGDSCTGSPTFTSYSSSIVQTYSVSQSNSESYATGQGTFVTRSVQSGTEWVVTESSVAGGTETVNVQVPVTVSAQEVLRVPVLTLFAPCTESSSTSTTTSTTSTTPTSSSTSSGSSTADPRTSSSSQSSSRAANSQNTNANPTPTPTPTPASNNSTESLTLITTTSLGYTTLPNGASSSYLTVVTVTHSGTLNGNTSGGRSGSSSSRAVGIGVGVAGGVVALILLIFGITWHIRRKRRNALDDPDDADIWAPNGEPKTPQSGANSLGPGYTFNPYSEGRTTAYVPVPTMSPPRARPMPLADPDDRGSLGASYGVPPAGGLAVAAPPLNKTKTADQILYEAAREDLPRSRTSSAGGSHRTRGSETGSFSHRPHASLTASNVTHASLTSRRSDSAVGLLEQPPSAARSSFHQDAQVALHYQNLMDAPADLSRPMSPVSVVAPRLAIANPDVDKDP